MSSPIAVRDSDEAGIPTRLIMRRGSSASNHSNVLSHSPTSYTPLSPPQARSFDAIEALERQRTMDVESAMLLSRARSTSIAHPHISPTHPISHSSRFGSVEDLNYPMLSKREEDEMTLARGGYEPGPSTDAFDSVGPEPLPTRTEDTIPDILNSLAPESESAHAKPPLYQPGSYRSYFDFSAMEQFATDERAILGLGSPAQSSGLEDLQRRLQQKSLKNTTGDGNLEAAHHQAEGSDDKFSRMRQRKLSQSHPKPRVRTGKLALFEGDVGAPPPSMMYPSMSAPSVNFGDGLPPQHTHPLRQDSGQERPFRFSFYSNSQPATIHSRSICELPAESQSFEELFNGSPKVTEDTPAVAGQQQAPSLGPSASFADLPKMSKSQDHHTDNEDPPTWWLDVLRPSNEEMRMFAKVFSIHPLTTEDILLEEAREKIELFRHYYLVCFRGFDQDQYSPTHLEPVNMYIIVFREGVLSFHFHTTPHPLNVRRRIKQLKDYISVTSDWISYALIDDITDAFGPLIQGIEYQVDSIDESVLILKEAEQSDMLRRIGTCRKKVMSLLRLMGNKADVVKGLAKRCNEHWSVAPKSDIGLYLSDIQDHLITMTQNLNHYEKILSRSHSNYLAQISIEMTDANNKINDVLSKLTALGTVLIPMNLITGLWGMNVHVPGQDIMHGYAWFISIVGVLVALAACGAFVTYRLMNSR